MSGMKMREMTLFTCRFGLFWPFLHLSDLRLNSGTDGRAIVWSCPNYTQRTVCVCKSRVDSLAWVSPTILVTNSPGLTELVPGSGLDASEGCVQVWLIMKGGATNPIPLCTIRHEGGGNVGPMAGWSPPPPPPWMRRRSPTAPESGRSLELLVTAAGSSHSSLRLWRPSVLDPHQPPTVLGALHGHDNEVTACAFSPDGSFLASASIDQTVLVWDVSTFRKDDGDSQNTSWCVRQLSSHTARVNSVSWAPTPPEPDEGGEYVFDAVCFFLLYLHAGD